MGFDEYMNLVLDDAEEVNVKKKSRKSLGRILLKGDNITLMMNTIVKNDLYAAFLENPLLAIRSHSTDKWTMEVERDSYSLARPSGIHGTGPGAIVFLDDIIWIMCLLIGKQVL
ncbi:unnamed protein product [Dovyalis caffra]|uniref:Small nuclear ribonucleoprotein E n=1 Tax=Dovyalis caffra TaxID=77055 RepID=A0AAV1S1J2_9ROSI|nr:unnamed protein product [Dovyalis caffra]